MTDRMQAVAEIAGFVCLVAAGALVDAALGLTVAGVGLIAAGNVERR